MQKHTKIYMRFFDYGEQDFILCENCFCRAVDIHHIRGRIGEDANDIKNLMALCRQCHDKAHGEKLSKEYLQEVHFKFHKNYSHKTGKIVLTSNQ